ncbi:human AMSH/STAMBP protein ubiquitin specific-protease [Rhodotorula kratochvilovae]
MSSQSRSADARTRQQQSSHMLKTGRRGNPFCKDTHDLFATLMVSLDLSDRTRFFRTYANAFTTDDAAANLASLRFSQSNRTSDPNDPQRIVTTTTTTTFSMSRDIAKGICQHFMDARLIENAADPSSVTFKDRGIYQITPKGLHILERFITKNGISADHLIPVFTTQPICMKLLHLERRQSDDEIHVSRSVIDVVFRRFTGGRTPNYVAEQHDGRGPTMARPFIESVRVPDSFDRANGVELQDVTEKTKTGQVVVVKQVFASTAGVDWLLDYSTCCCRDEAGELLAHMVRYGLVVLYADRSRTGDRVTVIEVQGTTGQAAEYRFGPRVLYRVTEEGRRVAQGGTGADAAAAVPGAKVEKAPEASSGSPAPAPAPAGRDSASTVEDDASSTRSFDKGGSFGGGTGLSNIEGSLVSGRKGMAELFKANMSEPGAGSAWSKDQHSTTTRLRAILDEPALRALFRDFLRANYCDENLGFWLEVSDFRRRFSTTSSAVGASSKRRPQAAANAMESHQQNLVAAALHIYNTYLAPLSPNELNIDHNLRADVVNYVNRSLAEVGAKTTGDGLVGTGSAAPSGIPGVIGQTTSTGGGEGVDSAPIPPLRATQVQTLLRQYERIQEHIFRLLATDQVPRFIRTEPFLKLMQPDALNQANAAATAASAASSASTPASAPAGDDASASASDSPNATPKPPQGQVPPAP